MLYVKHVINSYGGNWMSFKVKIVEKEQILKLALPKW